MNQAKKQKSGKLKPTKDKKGIQLLKLTLFLYKFWKMQSFVVKLIYLKNEYKSLFVSDSIIRDGYFWMNYKVLHVSD